MNRVSAVGKRARTERHRGGNWLLRRWPIAQTVACPQHARSYQHQDKYRRRDSDASAWSLSQYRCERLTCSGSGRARPRQAQSPLCGLSRPFVLAGLGDEEPGFFCVRGRIDPPAATRRIVNDIADHGGHTRSGCHAPGFDL
jgi:hypothetical protein